MEDVKKSAEIVVKKLTDYLHSEGINYNNFNDYCVEYDMLKSCRMVFKKDWFTITCNINTDSFTLSCSKKLD